MTPPTSKTKTGMSTAEAAIFPSIIDQWPSNEPQPSNTSHLEPRPIDNRPRRSARKRGLDKHCVSNDLLRPVKFRRSNITIGDPSQMRGLLQSASHQLFSDERAPQSPNIVENNTTAVPYSSLVGTYYSANQLLPTYQLPFQTPPVCYSGERPQLYQLQNEIPTFSRNEISSPSLSTSHNDLPTLQVNPVQSGTFAPLNQSPFPLFPSFPSLNQPLSPSSLPFASSPTNYVLYPAASLPVSPVNNVPFQVALLRYMQLQAAIRIMSALECSAQAATDCDATVGRSYLHQPPHVWDQLSSLSRRQTGGPHHQPDQMLQ